MLLLRLGIRLRLVFAAGLALGAEPEGARLPWFEAGLRPGPDDVFRLDPLTEAQTASLVNDVRSAECRA